MTKCTFIDFPRLSHPDSRDRISTLVVSGLIRYCPSFSMSSTDVGNNSELFNDERNRKTVWRTVVQVYNEFSSQSTIHGIKYTTQAKSTIGRCLWLFIVSLSLVASCQLANKFYERHESANMRTLVISNQHPSWKLELPAITFCHSNIAALHRLVPYLTAKKHLRMPFDITIKDFQESLKYLAITIYPSNLFEKELQILDRVLAANDMSLFQLFELTSPKCSDFLVMCQFEGKNKNCDDLITASLTPYGICCSFNYAHVEKGRRWNTTGESYYSVNFGARFILSFLVKSFGSDDRISSMMFGDGIKILVHDRYSYPGPTALEFIAATGQETVARLYGRHLTSSFEVLSLKPNERDCYKSNTPTDFYRADNCYVKCREHAFLHLCGCLPFYSSKIEGGQTTCNFSHISCLAQAKQKAYSLTLRNPKCNCLPDCESTVYSLGSTTLPFNAPQFNPSQFYRKARNLRNATAIHITYSEQSSMLQRRELVLSWINLVSSLGGVFSLFLGCSFISIIEIIYFFFIYLVWKLKGGPSTRSTTLGTT